MNKKTGEFSAADLKKPVGRKERSIGAIGPKPALKEDEFFCTQCRRTLFISFLAFDHGVAHRECRSCVDKSTSIMNGTFRTNNGNKYETYQKNTRKTAEKHYKSGKLPKWMFS